jgi:hypothetical protein
MLAATANTARPIIIVKLENDAVVLQFRLLRPLELPRLPEDFKFTEEAGAQVAEAAARPKAVKGDNIMKARPYDVTGVRALLSHLKEARLSFTGFSYTQRPDVKTRKTYHVYRFVFSRTNEMDEKFQKVRGDLFTALEYLLGRPGLAKEGGMEMYRNPATDANGNLIQGKTWLSCNFAEGVFPFQQNTAAPKKKERIFGTPKTTKEERDALRFVEAGLKGKGKLFPWKE